MVEKRPALGRGLAALIPDAPISAAPSERPLEVDIDLLRPNRFQPRTTMDDAASNRGGMVRRARPVQTLGWMRPKSRRR